MKLLRWLCLGALTCAARLFAQDVTLTIDATHDRNVIPDVVYGVNDISIPGATVHRHGGNRLTGFNWENNASNAGTDYINSSDSYLGSQAGIGNTQTPGAVLQAWMDADRAAGLQTLMTLPLAGYVAADMNGSVSQAETAPSARWKQVVAMKGAPLSFPPNTTDGYVYLDEMVNYLLSNYGRAAGGGVAYYNLDNEPALWPSTHPRIHPSATGYAELVSRHVPVASMVTAMDANAQVYGPTLYGWNAHLNLQNAPDSGSYNNSYGTFTNYYLAQMQSASNNAAAAQVQPVASPSFSAGTINDTLPAMSASLYEVQTLANSFAAWQQQQFGDAAGNPGIAGATADPDRDGLRNLLEYVTGRDPNNAENNMPLVASSSVQNNVRIVQLQFYRRKNLTDVQLSLQTSSDLTSWTDHDPASLNPTITSIDAQTDLWTIQMPVVANEQFYRLSARL